MKRKRIKFIVTYILIAVLASSVSVFADGAKSWS